MNNPLVSIIIPTYNRAHLIGETLDSVLAQTYQNWECIIVDDGSTDNSEEVIGKYIRIDSRFQYHHRPINSHKGASSCRNLGLSYSKGEFVIFLDSDDMLLDYGLQNRISEINQFPNNDFWVFPMYTQNEGQREVFDIGLKDSYLIDFLSYKIRWQTMCTLWNASFIKKINGFNELYPRLNDPEVHIRAILESQNNFHIFNDVLPDSVYRITTNRDLYTTANNYADSLLLFIPDIKNKLIEYEVDNEIKYLKEYLRYYFLSFYKHNARRNNIRVVRVFYQNKFISSFTYSKFLIFYYLYLIFNYGTKKVREKLEKLITNL